MIKHTNIKHKKKESLENVFLKLSYSQTSDSHKFQIIQIWKLLALTESL